MRFPVFADQAAAIHAEHDGQTHDAGVVEHFVKCALQKRGVDGDNRAFPACCQPGRHGDGVFFGDADVDKTLRKPFGKRRQPDAGLHGGGDGKNVRISGSQLRERRAESGAERFAG